MVSVPLGANRSVWPSGAARATAWAPITVPPPVRFSITTVRPSRSVSFGPITRAMTSMTPPAPSGMTKVIGRDGKSCARRSG